MSDDLKLCPFCASPALALHAMHSVICSSRSETTCAAIYYDPKEWQQRPIEDALRARAEAAEAEAARLRSDRSALIVAALVGSNVGRTLPLHCRPMLDRLAAEVVAIAGADDREALGAYVEAMLLAEAQPAGEVSR